MHTITHAVTRIHTDGSHIHTDGWMDRQTRIQSDIDRIAQTDAPPGGGPPIPGGPGGPPGKPGGGGPKPGPPPMPGGPRCCTVRVDACQSVGVDVRVLVLTHVTRLVDTPAVSIHTSCRYTSLAISIQGHSKQGHSNHKHHTKSQSRHYASSPKSTCPMLCGIITLAEWTKGKLRQSGQRASNHGTLVQLERHDDCGRLGHRHLFMAGRQLVPLACMQHKT